MILIFSGIWAKMTIEEMIEHICSKHPEVSKEQILSKFEEKKKKMGGFIADEVLLRMIAADLGVDIKNDETLANHKLLIKDLVPGLNDVTVTGRIIAMFTPKAFEGKRKGKFASLLIADEHDILRVVLWNDKTSIIESGKVKVGQIIRFVHGYTRENRSGKVELHIGEKSEIEINAKDIKADAYPNITKFATKISEITPKQKGQTVNIIGVVKSIFPASVFKRQDSSSGKVMRLALADETGEIPVVLWNDKVDELEKMLEQSSELQIVHGRLKKSLGGGFEVHVDNSTYVGVFALTERFLKIADLRKGLENVNIKGEIATKPTIRDVKTSRGETVKLGVFELKDETGRIWVSLWRKKAELVNEFKLGEKVVIKNAYVKKGFGDQLELSTKNTTEITVLN